jgi:hypothetical protein
MTDDTLPYRTKRSGPQWPHEPSRLRPEPKPASFGQRGGAVRAAVGYRGFSVETVGRQPRFTSPQRGEVDLRSKSGEGAQFLATSRIEPSYIKGPRPASGLLCPA